MQRKKIGLREVRALQPTEIIWDTSVTGFGARRQAGNVVSYFLKYRTADGRQRWMTIGRHGSPWTPDTARDRAREILGEVVTGADPSGEKIAKRRALTVAELCERYFEDAVAGYVAPRFLPTPKQAGRCGHSRMRLVNCCAAHLEPAISYFRQRGGPAKW